MNEPFDSEQLVSPMCEHIQRLEERIKELERSDYDERIHDLENVEAEPRLNNLESARLTQHLDPKVWVYVNERLDKLESMVSLEIAHLEARTRELERFQDITHLEYKAKRKPHKCPVCDGRKKTTEIKKETLKLHDNEHCKMLAPHSCWNMCMSCKGAFHHEYEDCLTCEGKGVVWG